ncbi:histone deacetylase [soil metagenome]
MRPAFIWHPDYEANIGRHVFPTQKFRLMREMLLEKGLVIDVEIEQPQPATDDELLAVLTPEYLVDMRGGVHTERTLRSELPLTADIIRGMILTAGGTILCARRALERGGACHLGGGYHHAYADHAEGFCYINDVAIAARVLLREGLVKRVAVIDTDVHQGNGTAHIFHDDDNVYTFSIHEENNYPRPKEKGSLDMGLDQDPGQEEYLSALHLGVRTAVDEFKPDLVFNVAGVDPYKEDQLGRLGLTWETMRRRDEMVLSASAAKSIPFVTVVAGGYARNVQDTVGLHVQTIEVAIKRLARCSAV